MTTTAAIGLRERAVAAWQKQVRREVDEAMAHCIARVAELVQVLGVRVDTGGIEPTTPHTAEVRIDGIVLEYTASDDALFLHAPCRADGCKYLGRTRRPIRSLEDLGGALKAVEVGSLALCMEHEPLTRRRETPEERLVAALHEVLRHDDGEEVAS
jgi:hypothetical protein